MVAIFTTYHNYKMKTYLMFKNSHYLRSHSRFLPPFFHRCLYIIIHLVSTLPQPHNSTGPWPRFSTMLREVRCHRQHSKQVLRICFHFLLNPVIFAGESCTLWMSVQAWQFISAHFLYPEKITKHLIDSMWKSSRCKKVKHMSD